MSAEAAPKKTLRRPSLWRHADFLKLWSAETVSQFGTQVSQLALPLIAAIILKVTPLEFALLGTVEMLPFILISLPAGVWVDRLRRRPILIIGDLGRGLALLSIPIAYVAGVLTIWQLYAVALFNGTLTVFFDVAYQSYLPSLVERDDILEGNSKMEISRSSAAIAGPGIAGFLIGIASAPIAVILDSISYLGSALFVLTIRKHEPAPEHKLDAQGKRASMRTEIAAGLGYVLHHKYLRYIAACTAWSNLFSSLGFAIMVLYLVRTFGVTAEQLGIAFSISSLGLLVGALVANRIGNRIGVGRTIILSAFVFGPSLLPIAIATHDTAVPLLALSGLIGGFGSVVYNINQVSLRQAITPTAMQGKMNATMRFIVWGTMPLGSILGGVLGGTIGLSQTIWVAAVGGLFAVVPLLLTPLSTIVKMPEPVGDEIAIATESIEDIARPVPGTPLPIAED